MITDMDLVHLRNCVALAEQALEGGHSPFGSVLANNSGEVLYADHNRDGEGDRTRHPEFAIARWATAHLSSDERVSSVVYTSGEHCPMCSAAHAWAGLGRIVYVSSAEQLSQWLAEFGVPGPPTAALPITQVAPGLQVEGPVPELVPAVKELQRRYYFG